MRLAQFSLAGEAREAGLVVYFFGRRGAGFALLHAPFRI